MQEEFDDVMDDIAELQAQLEGMKVSLSFWLPCKLDTVLRARFRTACTSTHKCQASEGYAACRKG